MGEQQRFFRSTGPDSGRRYYTGTNLDVTTTPGQFTAAQALITVTNLATWKSACPVGIGISSSSVAGATATHLNTVDSTGTLTDQGAHGAGTHAGQWGLCNDGQYVYIAGATKIRKWDGSSFTDFSVTASVGALATLNNALYSCDGSTLNTYDGSGTKTTVFTWKDNTNTARATSQVRLAPYGGQLLIFFPYLYEGPELWIYDGTGCSRLASLPESSAGYDMCVNLGVVYMSTLDVLQNGQSTATIYYYANGSLGVQWRALASVSGLPSATSMRQTPLASYAGKVAFVDWASSTLKLLDPASGYVSTIGNGMNGQTADQTVLASSSGGVVACFGNGFTGISSAYGRFFPASTQAVTAVLQTSAFDFDSSLTKVMRGVTVNWTGASGTVDIAYQVGGAGGSYISLQASAVSGTEYPFPTNTSGRNVSIQLTLNGSGGSSPTVTRLGVRASPVLNQFRSGTYILDCTGSPDAPRELRDNTYHQLTGYDQVKNLLTAAKSTVPFSVTDKINGTFTGIVDLQDSEGWDVYEVHPNPDNPKKPGSYMVRVKIREV